MLKSLTHRLIIIGFVWWKSSPFGGGQSPVDFGASKCESGGLKYKQMKC